MTVTFPDGSTQRFKKEDDEWVPVPEPPKNPTSSSGDSGDSSSSDNDSGDGEYAPREPNKYY